MDLQASTVDISQSTVNSVSRDQFNVGRDNIIFNLSDMSSDSLVSVSSTSGVIATISSFNTSNSEISVSTNKRTRHMSGNSSGAEDDPDSRKDSERTRRRRIESAKTRRRDEFRDTYTELENELPKSNGTLNLPRISTLKRAVNYVRQLKRALEQANMSLAASDAEMSRLRKVNQSLIMGTFSMSGSEPSLTTEPSPTSTFANHTSEPNSPKPGGVSDIGNDFMYWSHQNAITSSSVPSWNFPSRIGDVNGNNAALLRTMMF